LGVSREFDVRLSPSDIQNGILTFCAVHFISCSLHRTGRDLSARVKLDELPVLRLKFPQKRRKPDELIFLIRFCFV